MSNNLAEQENNINIELSRRGSKWKLRALGRQFGVGYIWAATSEDGFEANGFFAPNVFSVLDIPALVDKLLAIVADSKAEVK